jgi:hypothetical protein
MKVDISDELVLEEYRLRDSVVKRMGYEPCRIAVGVMKVRFITSPEACCLATRAIEERCNGQLTYLRS